MRSAILSLVAGVVVTGPAYGQQPNEHLKGFAPFIGTWRYEGPTLEDIPDVAEKGTKCVFCVTWSWILDKQVVMSDWQIEIEGGATFSGKSMIGWNAADRKIVAGLMDSGGSMALGTFVLDSQAKTITLTSEGVDGEGAKTSMTSVVTRTGKDTLTWQAPERTGGIVEGPSPVVPFQRVKRTKGGGVARGAEPNEHLKGYRSFIGRWRHEGPVLEGGPFAEEAEKNSNMVVDISWRWILDKQVIMYDWTIDFQGGPKISGKELIDWNAADNKIVGGGMNSLGGMGIGTRVIDGKTISSTNEGVDGEGVKSSYKEVIKKTDKDTLTWQAVERTGGDSEGLSPVYTFKRAKRTGKKAAK